MQCPDNVDIRINEQSISRTKTDRHILKWYKTLEILFVSIFYKTPKFK